MIVVVVPVLKFTHEEREVELTELRVSLNISEYRTPSFFTIGDLTGAGLLPLSSHLRSPSSHRFAFFDALGTLKRNRVRPSVPLLVCCSVSSYF